MRVYRSIRNFFDPYPATGLNHTLGVIYVLESVLRESSLPLSF